VSDKYLIDVSRLIDRLERGRLPTGVDRVLLAYVERYGAHSSAMLQRGQWRRLMPAQASRRLFALLLRPPSRMGWAVRSVVARACVPPWPSQIGGARPAFFLGQTGLEKPGFGDWVRSSGLRPVFFVHDLLPLSHPEFFPQGAAQAHALRMDRVLELGAGVVVNSADTLSGLIAYAQARGVAMPVSAVAPLAPAPLNSGEKSLPPLAGPYFVALGTIEPRKNHLLLLNVWRELVARLGAAAPKLVVVGQRGWECEQVVDMLERCAALKDHVLEVPRCTDRELSLWLRHARALLFPSFAEGYGMPMVEALSVGTPVVASRLSVFQEVAGSVPDYLSPIDGEGWLQAVQDYADGNSLRRADQLKRLTHYRLPTWDDHFLAVENLLRQLAMGAP